jgi:hypothetical protein
MNWIPSSTFSLFFFFFYEFSLQIIWIRFITFISISKCKGKNLSRKKTNEAWFNQSQIPAFFYKNKNKIKKNKEEEETFEIISRASNHKNDIYTHTYLLLITPIPIVKEILTRIFLELNFLAEFLQTSRQN